jgi:hypothetical protein
MHVILNLRVGIDDPKGRKVSVPELKITNPGMGLDFLKEILYLNHNQS